MDERLSQTSQPVTRRRFLRGATGALASFVALRAKPTHKASARAQDYCYWRVIQGPLCSGGRKLNYQCLYCCGGGFCEQVQCGWYDVGPC